MAALGPRRAGSAAGLENEQLLLGELRAAGLENVRAEPIPITTWEVAKSALAIDSGNGYQPMEAQWMPYAAFTPEAGVEGPLAWAEPAAFFQRGDWRGKVVVTEIGFPPLDVALLRRLATHHFDPDGTLFDVKHPATWVRLGWHLYREAFRRGAVGFIGILKDQPGGSCRMYAPYGFKEADFLDKPLPAFWVGRKGGPALRALALSGRGSARLTLTGVRAAGVTHNLVGEVPGALDEPVVLSCHHDSPFTSPVEDASGCAVVLGLARHFAKRRGLRRRLIVLFSAGHFYGSIGTRTFIREHHEDVVRKAALEISIEHVAREAVEDASGKLAPSGRPEATGVFVPFNRTVAQAAFEAVRDHGVDRTLLLTAEGPLGDYPPTDGGDWHEAGVPTVNCISNPVYLLTDDDALAWVDQERLPKVAAAFAALIDRLDALPREQLTRRDWPLFRLAMKALKHVARARTTAFGTRPVY
jgi:hypothetical protein